MYSTGSATGVVDLITQLEAFMATNGWTTDSFATEGSGKRLHAHNGSVYFNARAYLAETPNSSIHGASGSCSSLAFNISTAGTGGSAWFDKTGSPVGTSSKYMTAGLNGITSSIPAYHFFALDSGNTIIVVIEHASGYFQMLGFGTLSKYGTLTGGTFFFGSLNGISNSISTSNGFIPAVGFFTHASSTNQGIAPAFVSLSVDSETGWHWSENYNEGRDSAKRYIKCNLSRFETTVDSQPNSFNGLAVYMPVVCSVERDANHNGSTHTSPIGELPETFYVQIRNLTPGQQVTFGSEDYRVFPFFHKDISSSIPSNAGSGHSSTWGFAVKEG